MAGFIKYEVPVTEAIATDVVLDNNKKILSAQATIDSNVANETVDGVNGSEIASDILTTTVEAIDTIIDESLKGDREQIKKAKLWLTKPISAVNNTLNAVSEYQIQKESGASTFKAIYVATGETVVEGAITAIDLAGGILKEFGAFDRFAIATDKKLEFVQWYRDNSEENVRDWFAKGADYWEGLYTDAVNDLNEAGANIPNPESSFEMGTNVTVIDDPVYDNFKYIKNPAGSNEIELIAPYNILEATEDDGDDLIIRSGKLPIETDAHSIIDGGVGQDTISYAEASLPNGVEINLDLGVSSSLDRDTGLGNGFPIDVLDNFENAVGSQNNDYIVGNKLDNTLEGMGGSDRLTGGDGNDFLNGQAREDHLFGNAGRDTLNGGDDDRYGGWGRDILEGGTGIDEYHFNGEYNIDTVRDSDGEGRIFVDGEEISGTADWVGTKLWKLPEHYLKEEDGNMLLTSKDYAEYSSLYPDSYVVLEDFVGGESKFNIELPESESLEATYKTNLPSVVDGVSQVGNWTITDDKSRTEMDRYRDGGEIEISYNFEADITDLRAKYDGWGVYEVGDVSLDISGVKTVLPNGKITIRDRGNSTSSMQLTADGRSSSEVGEIEALRIDLFGDPELLSNTSSSLPIDTSFADNVTYQRIWMAVELGYGTGEISLNEPRDIDQTHDFTFAVDSGLA